MENLLMQEGPDLSPLLVEGGERGTVLGMDAGERGNPMSQFLNGGDRGVTLGLDAGERSDTLKVDGTPRWTAFDSGPRWIYQDDSRCYDDLGERPQFSFDIGERGSLLQ